MSLKSVESSFLCCAVDPSSLQWIVLLSSAYRTGEFLSPFKY